MSRTILRTLLALLPVLVLSACGGGGGGSSGTTGTTSGTSYRITGTLSGLASGQSLTLYDKLDGDSLNVAANGSFAFAQTLGSGANYAVTISSQPTGQQCFVTDGLGVVGSSDVTTVKVSCSTAYRIGGTVNGLPGSQSLTLIDNSIDRLVLSTGGAFTFSQPLSDGQAYNVAVAAQPAGATCVVSSGSGLVNGSNVSLTVNCTANQTEYLYTGEQNSPQISQFSIDSGTGNLAAIGTAPAPMRPNPVALAADALGRYLFVANGNSSSNQVTPLSISGTDGSLTVLPTSATGNNPYGVAVTPDGKFVYVSNYNDDTITELAWNGSTLTALGTVSSRGTGPEGLVMSPGGTFLYALNSGNDTLTAFSVDTTSGLLSPIGGPVATGVNPYTGQSSLTPGGQFLYVANYGSANISGYSLASDGLPSPLPGSPFAAGTAPFALAINPAGTFAYVVNQGADTLSTFQIDPTYGTLSAVGAPVATGVRPEGVGVDLSGRYLYVANNGPLNPTNQGSISQYVLDPGTGVPSPGSATTPTGMSGPGPLLIVR